MWKITKEGKRECNKKQRKDGRIIILYSMVDSLKKKPVIMTITKPIMKSRMKMS